MSADQNDMTPEAAAMALRWLAELGAEEIIGETAVDRFAVAPLAAAPASAARALPARAAAPAPPPAARTATGGSDAVAAAAACTSLAEITAALSAFDGCPLKKTATNLCFCDGNPAAHVMLVGEAPGREEDIEGRPFVGRSGQLLDRMLAAIGLSRKSEDPETAVFITNTIFWRPPGNRDPTEAETAMCLPFLRRTIEVQAPRFIMCLGKTSSQRLAGSTEGILKLRGRWRYYDAGGRTIPLLPSLHPAYLLRQPAQKRLAWRDLLMLRQALDAH
jgi:uracil-DNA glycosylase family 4